MATSGSSAFLHGSIPSINQECKDSKHSKHHSVKKISWVNYWFFINPHYPFQRFFFSIKLFSLESSSGAFTGIVTRQYPVKIKNLCASMCVSGHTSLKIHKCQAKDTTGYTGFPLNNILKTVMKKITNCSAGGHLLPRAKGVNTRAARGPGNCSSEGPTALGHYSALPLRSDGGWEGAQPHAGHRGCNKSQMCCRDAIIYMDKHLASVWIWACTHTHAHASNR